ncbi:MAG: AAA family ATPase [Planctomycetia bacterium]|nr:AAA family ATPase [Planctomycetia bacterium]
MSTLDPVSQGEDSPGSGNGNGALATIDSVVHQVPALSWAYGPPQRPEILKARPNPVELIHAVRRRWPLAIGLGVSFSSIVAGLVWFFVPVQYEAFALLRVFGKPPAVLGKLTESMTDEFTIFKRTQVDLIKSGLVMHGTLRDKEINRLAMVQEHSDDPVAWLSDHLIIDYPNDAEILRIAMKGQSPAEVTKIVNKVVDIYLKEIVQHEKEIRNQEKAKLEQSHLASLRELRQDLESLHKSEEVLGVSSSEAAQIQKRLVADQLADTMTNRSRIIENLDRVKLQIMLAEARKEKPEDVRPPDAAVEYQLSQDQQIIQASQRLSAYYDRLADEELKAARRDDPNVLGLRHKIQKMEQNIEDRKATMRPQLLEMHEASSTNNNNGPALTPLPLLEKEKEYLEAAFAEVDKGVADKAKDLQSLEKFSADVTSQRERLAQRSKIASQIEERLRLIDVESLAQDRITKVDDASVPSGNDAIRKYVGLAFAAIFTFGLVVLAVAYVEFQTRKVNSIQEVNDGLGIRVIGELPNVSGRTWRRLKGGKGPALLQALMAERIDATRTALIHTTAVDAPRVVMVTSAEPHEGKTTTASQLAASLARSGRRTLLIDADVRNAGAHRVFDLPQEPGLCELLRSEAARDAVVHPTRAANLWLLPAGRCDLKSVQALSTNLLGSVIADLCVQFDYLVIDSGPVLKVADSLLVGQHIDVGIVSVLKDVSKVPKVYEACERLRSVGITVMGAVVNGVNDDVARHGVELLMAETA